MKLILQATILRVSVFLQLAFALQAKAQVDTSGNPLIISGYAEIYYVYDFGKPILHNRPDFLYSFHRHHEVNLNLGFIQAAYDDENIRGKIALMSGTYVNANLADEPGALRNIFEAHAGVKISKTKNLWLEAGIFASHIGFESAIGANCWNMTRSILAENSPYYFSGAKISYTSNKERWFLSGLLLNGWQRIQRLPGNQTPAFGHQVSYTPNDKIKLNSSSFIGSDTPDSTRQMRYFHNFYAEFQFFEKFGLLVGFDIGAEQKSKGSNEYHVWYSPVAIARYTPNEKLAIAARVEYYSDKEQVIINTGTPNGFQTFGYSINMDLKLFPQVLWRWEARSFISQRDQIFLDRNQRNSKNNYFVGSSWAISF